MRFTVVGHAALFIESQAGPTILVDPWLSGSCYWRSWWHYPPCRLEPEWLSPDYVYLSHYHFDHFHYPSMRRIDRSATILCPRFGVDVMPKELHGLGFERVRELPHGDVIALAEGLEVASFQYGFDDSAFLVRDRDTVLCDLNDSKVRGRALAQVRDAFGPPTFMLKSHTFSIAYPLCYEADDPLDVPLVDSATFTDDFIEVAEGLEPQYAIPFASAIAFLHPESEVHNATQVTAVEVERAFDARPRRGRTRLVRMVAGDGWSREAGFRIADDDWYTDRESRLAKLKAEVQPKIDRSIADEAAIPLRFEVFERYLGELLAALPPGVSRLLLRRPLVFAVERDTVPYWVVDAARRRITRERALPDGWASITRIADGVLMDSIDKRLLSFATGAMRSRTRLAPGGISTDLAFWGLVIIWETGYLPLSRVLATRRFWSALWRRRREAIDQLAALASGGGSLLRRLSTGFASERAPRA